MAMVSHLYHLFNPETCQAFYVATVVKESMEMLGAMPPQASPPPQGPCPDTSA